MFWSIVLMSEALTRYFVEATDNAKLGQSKIMYQIFGQVAKEVSSAAERYFVSHGYSVLSRLDDCAFGMRKDDRTFSVVATYVEGPGMHVLFSIRAS